jgi:hypothetical protein
VVDSADLNIGDPVALSVSRNFFGHVLRVICKGDCAIYDVLWQDGAITRIMGRGIVLTLSGRLRKYASKKGSKPC